LSPLDSGIRTVLYRAASRSGALHRLARFFGHLSGPRHEEADGLITVSCTAVWLCWHRGL